MLEVFTVTRPVVLVRELTKIYEEIPTGKITEFGLKSISEATAQGECLPDCRRCWSRVEDKDEED